MSVKIINTLPNVAGTLKGRLLTATIGDADKDTVKYRMLVNGVVVQDWSEFKPPPVIFSYTIPKKNILAGKQNTVMLQVMDDLNQTQSWVATFTGKESGYAFIM